MRLALVQPDVVWESPRDNIKNLDLLLSRCDSSVDLIVLPEMFLTGFNVHPVSFDLHNEGEGIKWMQNKARLFNCFVCGSLSVKEGEHFYNRFYWVNPDGETDYYDKKHLFSMGQEDESFRRGEKRKYFMLGEWKILPSICYDLRFPVWHRNIAGNPYDLLINVANWPAPRMNVWDTLLKARAIENQCFVIGVNRTGTDGRGINYKGESMLIDPRGMAILNLKEDQKIALIDISRDELLDFRKKFPVLKDGDPFKLL